VRARVYPEARVAVRLKPGSLTHLGEVVDYRGQICPLGPCWVPPYDLVRALAFIAAGWTLAPPNAWRHPPAPNLVRIQRDQPE